MDMLILYQNPNKDLVAFNLKEGKELMKQLIPKNENDLFKVIK